MMLVVVESPYAGNVERNVRYARAAIADCLKRGESPFASHLLYTQPGVLDDGIPEERMIGIKAGFSWAKVADLIVFYTDFGWSSGMEAGLRRCIDAGQPYEYRVLAGPWSVSEV